MRPELQVLGTKWTGPRLGFSRTAWLVDSAGYPDHISSDGFTRRCLRLVPDRASGPKHSATNEKEKKMQKDTLTRLTAQALTYMKAGNELVGKAVGGTNDAASDEELKKAINKGTKLRELWHDRIEKALTAVGGPVGEEKNPIVEGLQAAGKRIKEQAPDDTTRDLGLCADGQLSLHYWMAAFGTVREYFAQLGLDEHVVAMQKTVDEAKEADEEHTQIATRILKS